MRKFGKTAGAALRRHLVATIISTAVIPASAQTAIDIQAQPLGAALSELGRQAGVNILSADNLVAGRTAPEVNGKLTVRNALDQMLKGTGLRAEQRGDKTFVIVKSPSEAQTKSQPQPQSQTVLPTMTVTAAAEESNGFVSDSTSTATRTDTPISETPQSIQIINSEQLQSQQIHSVTDALAMAGGVTLVNTGNGAPQVSIRGFTASTMSNGNVDTGFSNSLTMPAAAIEQIEVLKGADSILSGKMAPGGVINVTTKQPTATPTHQLTLQTGSYGDWLGAVDLGGALTEDKRLTYRFVLSAERAGTTFAGYDGQKNFYVAPSIGWKSGGTSVVLAYQHQVVNMPPQPLTLISNGRPLPLEGRPTPQGNSLIQSDTLSADFKQKFASIFEFESKSQYQASRFVSNHFFLPLWEVAPGQVLYEGLAGEQRSYGFDTDNHVRATVVTGPVRQTLLAGFDFSKSWTDSAQGTSIAVAPFPAVSLPAPHGPYPYYDQGITYADKFYLQDQLSWGRLHVLASISRGTVRGSQTPSQSAWSPNFGVLYQLTDSVAVYANAFKSFSPPSTVVRLVGGGVAPPSTGRTVEAGFKFNFFDDRLSMTADVYRSAVLNALQSVPGTPFYTLVGGQVTRGFEWSATGRVLPGLNIVANYTYADELQNDGGTSDVPRHAGNVWATYDFQGETLHGWGVGVGVQARSHYVVVGTNTVIPGQVQTDASVYYKTKRWTATLGIKNIFDNRLYQDQVYQQFVGVEPGRLIYLTGIYNF